MLLTSVRPKSMFGLFDRCATRKDVKNLRLMAGYSPLVVYKIWDLVYKIVQNKYKIMIYFSFSKSVRGAGDMHRRSHPKSPKRKTHQRR